MNAFDVDLWSLGFGAAALATAVRLLYELGFEFAPWAAQRLSLKAFALAGGALLAAVLASASLPGGVILDAALVLGTLLAVLRVRDASLTCPVERLRGSGMDAGSCACPAPKAMALAGLLLGFGLARHWTQVCLLPGYGILLIEARWKRRAWPPWRGFARMAAYPMLSLVAGWTLYRWLSPGPWGGFARGRDGFESVPAGDVFWVLLRQFAAAWTLPGLTVLGLGWALLLRKRAWLAVGLLCLPLGLALSGAYAPMQACLGLGLAGFVAVPPLRRWLGLGLLAGAVALAARNFM